MAFHKAKALQAAQKSVVQGKIAHAIKLYQEILDKDPSDVSLLNTIGDLYIRERNITEGLRQFYKLAEAYLREGFNTKAIAIYRKIFKVDPNSVEPLLRLAELYQLQGLGREARELNLQAVEAFKKRNQGDRALEILRQLVQQDPENVSFRSRLAAECEHQGRAQDAAQAYLESAEILVRRGDQIGAEHPLKKASELDPKSPKIQTLSASVALACGKPEQAENIINSSPELRADPAAKRTLLDAFVALRKPSEARALARELFNANPTDFTPVASVSALLVQTGAIDEAFRLIESVVEPLLSQNRDGTLLESLTLIWSSAPNHLPTLELIRRLSERTGNESTLAEALEALARVHMQSGELEKAERDYLQLIEREPDHHYYRGLLNSVQRKMGKAVEPVEFSLNAMGLEEGGPASNPQTIDAKRDSMVREAIENSDLCLRYNVPAKAIAELEKVLQVYPEQAELHLRVLEISGHGFPERRAAAASELARIFANRGDVETSNRYYAMAATDDAPQEIRLPSGLPGEAATKPPLPLSEEAAARAIHPSVESPMPATSGGHLGVGEAAPAPMEIPFDLTLPAVSAEPPVAPPLPFEMAELPKEVDLAGEFETLTAGNIQAQSILATDGTATALGESPQASQLSGSPLRSPQPPVAESAAGAEVFAEDLDASPTPPGMQPALAADLEDSKIEVDFYLDHGFLDEARRVLAELERKCPGNTTVTNLRRKFRTLAAVSAAKHSMEDGPAPPLANHDQATHYNQGMAFREMGLWDEAIGEFQQVVKIAANESSSANFFQACTLLATCFMQKKMPVVAVKWYLRALETPGLDEEGQLALEYELGVAYEQAGDFRKALERYTEVYSLNIDFRDVAGKVRDLQHQT